MHGRLQWQVAQMCSTKNTTLVRALFFPPLRTCSVACCLEHTRRPVHAQAAHAGAAEVSQLS